MTEQLKPGGYVGLYIDNVLIYTGALKDLGTMDGKRTQGLSGTISEKHLPTQLS